MWELDLSLKFLYKERWEKERWKELRRTNA